MHRGCATGTPEGGGPGPVQGHSARVAPLMDGHVAVLLTMPLVDGSVGAYAEAGASDGSGVTSTSLNVQVIALPTPEAPATNHC